ncbi:MAG TPA: TonB-dependent receptor [Gemmatimonadales bacterium]|jgi:iron complex outermembrane receptor protein|nr:TonB-dependent receptor [Gemmatimonadales bacterium]
MTKLPVRTVVGVATWVLLTQAAGGSLAAQGSDTLARRSLDDLLNTPVSTGAKYAQDVRQVAGSVSIVSAEDIRSFGYRTLEDVLQSMAGIYVSYDRNYMYVGARGFGRPTDYNNRVLLLFDGHSTNESMFGSAMLGEDLALDLNAVDRIEVVRGPASVLYGTGAMFAVVNIITKSGTGIQGVRAEVGGGNHGLQSASAVTGFALGSRGAVALSAMAENRDGGDLFFPEFDAPATHDGIAHNLDYQRRAGGTLAVQLGDLSLHGQATYRIKGVPTASYGQIFNDPRSQVRDAGGFLELKYDHDLSATRHLMVRTYYDGYYYDGAYPYVGDLLTDQASNRVAGAEAAVRWDPIPTNRITAGAEYRWNARTRYRVWDEGLLSTTISQPFAVVSLYLQDDFQILHNLSILAGVRHDNNSMAGGATTPRFAMIYDPLPGTTLKAMYGRAFRAPSLYEAAYPSAGQTIGPERLDMAELIWMQRLGKSALLTSSVYRYYVHDLIDAVADSDQSLSYRNRSEVRAQGFEATLDVRPASRLRGYLSYSLGRAVEDDGTTGESVLTNSPGHLLKLGLATQVSDQVSAAVELRYESGRKTVEATRTDPFFLANLNLAIHPFRRTGASRSVHGFEGLELALRITNLLGVRYSYPGGTEHIQPSIEQDGRAIMVRVGYQF